MNTKLCNIGNTIYRSIPLIPVFSTLYILIIYLSPMSWNGSELNYSLVMIALGLSIISAYSTTLFFDNYHNK